MNADFEKVLNHCGQHHHLTLELGTSVEEILGGKTLVNAIGKGFKASTKYCIISNMRKVLYKMLEKDD